MRQVYLYHIESFCAVSICLKVGLSLEVVLQEYCITEVQNNNNVM